ncbi:hypothetical protein [Brassicibacter mesophilus]|uniref:hypothetical protein n=1 Tax=Brassicibacter mesophilus TaxID=745119 RepID=UPI003D24E356
MSRRMYEWHKQIQIIVDEIDECIRHHHDEALTLRFLSHKLGYSEFHTTRKFKEILGMQFRDYLRLRKLAFALKRFGIVKKTFWTLLLIMVFHHMKLLPDLSRDHMV